MTVYFCHYPITFIFIILGYPLIYCHIYILYHDGLSRSDYCLIEHVLRMSWFFRKCRCLVFPSVHYPQLYTISCANKTISSFNISFSIFGTSHCGTFTCCKKHKLSGQIITTLIIKKAIYLAYRIWQMKSSVVLCFFSENGWQECNSRYHIIII